MESDLDRRTRRRRGPSSRRRRQRRSLSTTERLLAFVVRSTHDSVACMSPEGRILHCNPAGERLYGYPPEEYVGKPYSMFVRPQDVSRLEDMRRRLLEGETLPAFEHDVRRKDGALVRMLATAAAIRDDDGEIVGISVVHHDISAELEFRRALLEAQLETSLDGILIVDPTGARILSRNLRFAAMWEIPANLLASGADEPVLSWVVSKVRDPEAFLSRVRHLYAHPDESSFEELALRDGRTFERYSSPVLGARGANHGRIWYFRDVTQRKRSEQALAEKSRALARSNAELSMYADAASHDLLAPLNKMVAFTGLLSKRAAKKLDAQEKDLLERLNKTALRACTLVRDMLTLAKVGREALPAAAVDWRRVRADVLSDLEVVIAEAGASISFEDLPPLAAPELLLRRVLVNLISNAVKFRDKKRPLRVEVKGRRAGPSVEISVKDNGIGFDPRHAERIFAPFVRLHSGAEYDGSGLGLAICQRIAARLHGSITAASVPGMGSTFTLSLPAGNHVE